jgi:hypothetical protein
MEARPMNEKTEAEWEAEQDLATLVRAEEVQADQKRMKAAMKAKESQEKALAKLGNPKENK